MLGVTGSIPVAPTTPVSIANKDLATNNEPAPAAPIHGSGQQLASVLSWQPRATAPRDGSRIVVADLDGVDLESCGIDGETVAHWERWKDDDGWQQGWLDEEGDGAGYWSHWRPT